MFFRRLYIKWKIWRIQSEIDGIPTQLNFYWINLNTLNIRYYEGKLDVQDLYRLFIKQQIERKKKLQEEVENLKNTL